jgi:hypothetical protein
MLGLRRSAEEEVASADVAGLIFNVRAERRTADRVRQAREALEKAQGDLAKGIELLEKSGPYRSKRVAHARDLGLAQLRAKAELFRMYQDCLEQGEKCTEAEEARIRDQQRKDAESWADFKALLQPAG